MSEIWAKDVAKVRTAFYVFGHRAQPAQPMVRLSKLCWDCQLEDMNMNQWPGELGNSSTIGRFAPKPKSALWAALKLFSVCRPPPFLLDTSIWGPQEIWEVGRLPAERLRTSVLRQTSKLVIAIFGEKKGGAKDHVNFRSVSSGFCSFAAFFFRASKGIFAMGIFPQR